MNITSGWLVALLVVLAGLSFVITVIIVPRRRRKGIRKYIEQFLALVVTLLLAVLALAAYLNAQNQWYTTLESILVSGPQEVTAQTYGNQSTETVAGEIQHGTPSVLQENPASNPLFGSQITGDTSHGIYVTFNLAGSSSGKTIKTMAWLPPSYFTDSTREFPVIVGFTGFPGSLETYSETFDYGSRIMGQVQQNKMQESILLIPDVSPDNYDSECVDGEGNNEDTPKVESFVTQDLVSWAETNLRTINQPSAWATTGYSAGGYCAALFSIKHPDMFGNALVQSGYFNPIYSDGQQWRDPKDASYLLPKIVASAKPNIGIYFYGAKDDPLAMQDTEEFSQAVESPTTFELVTVPYGGHTSDVWEAGIDSGLVWLGGRAAPFAAG